MGERQSYWLLNKKAALLAAYVSYNNRYGQLKQANRSYRLDYRFGFNLI